MKHRTMRIITVLLVIVLLMSPLTVFATELSESSDSEDSRASNYIHSTYARTSNTNGTVKVYFQIVGTGTMNSIGAAQIKIKDSTGTVCATFNYKTTSGMMSYSASAHMGNVYYYNGSASTRYYAEVTFQASNNSGTDNRTYYTSLS